MIEVVGAYNTAFCYTGELEEVAAGQIKAVSLMTISTI